MKCEKCGNIIEDKYIWCPICGAKRSKGKISDQKFIEEDNLKQVDNLKTLK